MSSKGLMTRQLAAKDQQEAEGGVYMARTRHYAFALPQQKEKKNEVTWSELPQKKKEVVWSEEEGC